jgi:predicted esterase
VTIAAFALWVPGLGSLAGAQTDSKQDKHEEKAPAPANKGEVFAWHAADGLSYEYFVPASYDPRLGANLTLVLHGNGLDQRWTFWNHPAGKFRPDDVVVSPDGTTFTQGTNANEFLGERKDADRVHALIAELRKVFTVKQVFLYGHSQGSFFVFYYAGEHPDDVDGVVGHASGVWTWTNLAKSGHGKAIALLHGTDDANVPYGQSVGGREAYRDVDYPMVHLRTLWGRDHRPHWVEAANELAWCEGMVSPDAARVGASLDTLLGSKSEYGPDFAAIWGVAARLEKLAGAPPDLAARATKARAAVEERAAAIVAALDESLGKGKLSKVDGKPWMGLALRFLEEFDGVAPCAAWSKAHADDLAAVDKAAKKWGMEYWNNVERNPEKAFNAALAVLEQGWRNASAPKIAAKLESLLKEDGTKDKAGKKVIARAEEVLAAWRKAREDGFAAFESSVKGFAP